MRIWLITIGEPLPIGAGAANRLHRTGLFATFLAERGHEVRWWASAFSHFRKEHLFTEETTVSVQERLQIRLLRGCGYGSNLSWARVRDQRQLAAKFAREARQLAPPDIVVAALPPVELCGEAARYGREVKVPVVLDMRDMWPDIFADMLPRPLRPFGRLALWPMFRAARRACAGATAITGITEPFVEWGVRRAGRARSELDRSFPLAYSAVAPPAADLAEAERYWDGLGVKAEDAHRTVCFIGNIGRHLEMDTLIRGAALLRQRRADIRMVICGAGDRLEWLRKQAGGDSMVLFPGWVNAAQIHVLMRRCLVGLDPLPLRYDFLATINNKAIEYLSAGLPVLSSPQEGVLHELLRERRCGLSYACGDPAGLARVIEELAADRPRHLEMKGNALRVFEEMFVSERVYEAFTRHLMSIALHADGHRTAKPERAGSPG